MKSDKFNLCLVDVEYFPLVLHLEMVLYSLPYLTGITSSRIQGSLLSCPLYTQREFGSLFNKYNFSHAVIFFPFCLFTVHHFHVILSIITLLIS
jgi:hypothetical protein